MSEIIWTECKTQIKNNNNQKQNKNKTKQNKKKKNNNIYFTKQNNLDWNVLISWTDQIQNKREALKPTK